jgi:hypothetical protein
VYVVCIAPTPGVSAGPAQASKAARHTLANKQQRALAQLSAECPAPSPPPLPRSMSSWSCWSDHQRALYLDVLHSYNVASLVHGHTHICVLYKFKGLDVLNAPATQRENATSSLPPSFLVVQLDMGSGVMRVAERVGEGWGEKVMTKQVVVPKQ